MHLIYISSSRNGPVRIIRLGAKWIVAVSIVLGVAAFPARSVRAADGARISILESNTNRIVMELVVDVYELQSVEEDGLKYQRVHIPGSAISETPGAPQMPIIGSMVGVPSIQGVSLNVLETSYETLLGILPYPSPQYSFAEDTETPWTGRQRQASFALDSTIYDQNAFYPLEIAEIGMSGAMRDQLVAQVQFSPVQSNPVTGETRVFRKIVVEIIWDKPVDSAKADRRPTSPAYENVLRNTLLNYISLDRPKLASPQQPLILTANQLNAAGTKQPVLKVHVDIDGIYRLNRQDLIDAGINLNGIDPRLLRMHNLGTEIAIHVAGENDGVFDVDDYVLFYGEANANLYSTENVYRLSVGSSNGKRMTERDGAPTGASEIPSHFPTHLRAEKDTYYWVAMPDGNGLEYYFWDDRLSPSTQGLPQSRVYTVTLGHVATNAPKASIKVRLKGYTSLEHHTKLYVNNNQVDNRTWDGQVVFDHIAQFNHSILNNGQNVVRIETLDTGASVDQILVDWIEIDYTASYIADTDRFRFGVPGAGTYRFQIPGFDSSGIHVFEITDSANPVLFTNTSVVAVGSDYTLKFKDNAAADDDYLAVSSDELLSPASIVLDTPSAWKSGQNGADFIIITHADLYSSTLPLASHRSGQGMRVAVAKIDDLYDEFTHSVLNPKAIRDFLRYAYNNWQAPAPTYVLLVGDAYQDFRDVTQTGTKNYVPSQLYESQYGQTVSDNWFVKISGDDILPDMLIGRLSAESDSQVDDIVAKIIAYDQNPPQGGWAKQVLFVADDDEAIYESLSESLTNKLPHYYTADKVYVKSYPPDSPRDDITDAINNGRVLVNYAGHGEPYAWGKWNQEKEWIYRNEDIQGLNNAGKLPFVTVGNCLNGWFSRPRQSVTIAEVLQRKPASGAVAVWASTELGTPPGHVALISEFFDAVLQDDQLELGAATTAAKVGLLARSEFWGLLVETYVLFGDPATILAIPTNYPYVEDTTPADGASGVAIDQNLRIKFYKPMNTKTVNLAPVSSANLTLTPHWNPQNTEVVYSHAGFELGRTYQFSVSGQDMQGNLLGPGVVPSNWSFSVTKDNVAPTVALQVEQKSPAPGTLPVSIGMSFSEPMRTESVVITLNPPVNNGLLLTWDSAGKNGTVAFTENADIVIGQSYKFTVTGGKDWAGNDLAQPAQISFSLDSRTYLPTILR